MKKEPEWPWMARRAAAEFSYGDWNFTFVGFTHATRAGQERIFGTELSCFATR